MSIHTKSPALLAALAITLRDTATAQRTALAQAAITERTQGPEAAQIALLEAAPDLKKLKGLLNELKDATNGLSLPVELIARP